MEPARCNPMIVCRTLFLLMLASLLALVYAVDLKPTAEAPIPQQVSGEAEVLSMEHVVPEPEPMPEPERPVEQQAPVVAEEKIPVQPITERGDALVFECDVLFNTPFDQAVVMPFD